MPASEPVPPHFWWVNQSRAYEVERGGGYVYAGKFSANGRVDRHHSDLTRHALDDVTLHAPEDNCERSGE